MGVVPESGDLKDWLDMYDDNLSSYDDLRREIKRWAKEKRLDSNKPSAGPLGSRGNADHPTQTPGVGQGQGQPGNYGQWYGRGPTYSVQTSPNGYPPATPQFAGFDLDAFKGSKGGKADYKGVGKGVQRGQKGMQMQSPKRQRKASKGNEKGKPSGPQQLAVGHFKPG